MAKRSKILITGTAGFIGHNLAKRLLEAGHAVLGVDSLTNYYDVSLKTARLSTLAGHSEFTASETALEDFAGLSAVFDAFEPHFVVHLAALRRPFGRASRGSLLA
jgi:UDP-glucuronate 4-epimerase